MTWQSIWVLYKKSLFFLNSKNYIINKGYFDLKSKACIILYPLTLSLSADVFLSQTSMIIKLFFNLSNKDWDINTGAICNERKYL